MNPILVLKKVDTLSRTNFIPYFQYNKKWPVLGVCVCVFFIKKPKDLNKMNNATWKLLSAWSLLKNLTGTAIITTATALNYHETTQSRFPEIIEFSHFSSHTTHLKLYFQGTNVSYLDFGIFQKSVPMFDVL